MSIAFQILEVIAGGIIGGLIALAGFLLLVAPFIGRDAANRDND